MLKLKLQYFDPLVLRTDSFEKTLIVGKIEGRRRRGRQRMRWMDGITNQWTWIWVDPESWWWTGRPGVLQFMGLQRVGHNWATELNWIKTINNTIDIFKKLFNNSLYINNRFIQIESIYQNIHPLKVDLSIFTRLCKYHHNLIPEYFHHKSISNHASFSFSSHPGKPLMYILSLWNYLFCTIQTNRIIQYAAFKVHPCCSM